MLDSAMQGAPVLADTELGPGGFPSTHWSVVLSANGDQTSAVTAALETLFRAYQKPLYAYIRRRGKTHHDAQDSLQAFFARLLARDALRTACRERGRFRSFLLTALKNFLADEHDHDRAVKRGGQVAPLSLDATAQGFSTIPEPAAPAPRPERLFDQEWARAIFTKAVDRLEHEFASEGKQLHFNALAPFLSRPPGPGEYGRVASGIGIRAGLMATIVSRLRRRFHDLVRAEIAATVASPAEVDAELHYLVELMTG